MIPPSVTTLLIDLDGTLVQMNRRSLELRFLLRGIWRFAPAIWPWQVHRAFWKAADSMQANDSDRTNYRVFVEALGQHSRVPLPELEILVRRLIAVDFSALSGCFSPVPGARELLLAAQDRGFGLVLATNPVWPLTAVRMRLRWGNVGDLPFDHVASSETMTRCKPGLDYYRQLLDLLSLTPEECVMIGDNPVKDAPASALGITTFIVGGQRGPSTGVSGADGYTYRAVTFERLRGWIEAAPRVTRLSKTGERQ